MGLALVCGAGCGSAALNQAGSHQAVLAGDVNPTNVADANFYSGRAIRCNIASQTSYVRVDSVVATSQWVTLHCSAYFASAPAADVQVGVWGGVLLGTLSAFIFRVADGKLYLATGANMAGMTDGATGITLPTGRTFYLDIEIDQRANPRLYNGWVDGAAVGGRSVAAAAANVNIFGWGTGLTHSATVDYKMGDFAVSITAGEAPIGAGHADYFNPTGDGTHNLGAAGNVQDAGGTDIHASTNPAFGDLDDLPGALDANAVLFKTDTGGGTYVELTFRDSTDLHPPIAASYGVFYKGAAANGYAGQWRTSANGFTNSDTVALSPATGTTQRAMFKTYPTTPGAGSTWSDSLVDAITMRIGFGSDVTPDIQFDAVQVEVWFKGADHAGAVAMTATATLAAAASLTLGAAAAFTANATLTPAPALTLAAAVALTASATLEAAGTALIPGAIALTATATQAADATIFRNAETALTASATLAAAAEMILAGAVALTATATLTPAAFLTLPGAVALTATATLAALPLLTLGGATSLTATATLAAAGAVTWAATVALTASAVLAAAGTLTYAGAVALSASATLEAAASLTWAAAVALTATATLSPGGSVVLDGAAALTASATLAALAFLTLPGAIALTATATLAAAGDVNAGGTTHNAEVALTATATLAAAAAMVYSATLAARTNLVSNGGVETNTTGYTTSGANAIARVGFAAEGIAHLFGTQALRATYQDSLSLVDYNSFTAGAAVAHIGSVYVLIPSSWDGGQIQINPIAFTGVGFGATAFADMSIRDRWQRISRVFTPAGGDLTGGLRVSAASAPTAGRVIYIDGLQAELGSSPTGYIETDGAPASIGGLEATATLTAAPMLVLAGAVALTASATVDTQGIVILGAVVALSATASLSPAATMTLAAAIVLTATATLSATESDPVVSAAVSMTAIAILFAEATLIAPTGISVIDAFALDVPTIFRRGLDAAAFALGGYEAASPAPGGLDAAAFTLAGMDRERIERRALDG